MENGKLIETIADIAYIAGENRFFSGDSRSDVSEFLRWAEEFQANNNFTNWDEENYQLAIQHFTINKIKNLSVV